MALMSELDNFRYRIPLFAVAGLHSLYTVRLKLNLSGYIYIFTAFVLLPYLVVDRNSAVNAGERVSTTLKAKRL